MLKRCVPPVLCLFMLVSGVPAQEAKPQVLMILGTFNQANITNSLQRAVQFKQAGIDVSIIFERAAVLSFLDLHGELDKPEWKKKVADILAEKDNEPRPERMTNPKYSLAKMNLRTDPQLKLLLQKVKDMKIPYVVCSASAKRMMGIYGELKAAGEPMSPEMDLPVDISPYLSQGYQVLTF